LGALLLSTHTLHAQSSADTSASTTALPQAPRRATGAYMNVSFVGLTAAGFSTARDLDRLQTGHHDPSVRGFSIPNAEFVLDGAVDPYFKGFVAIVHKLDPEAETVIELEEMYVLTTALPGSLQLKVG
jgi:hypothetical protein